MDAEKIVRMTVESLREMLECRHPGSTNAGRAGMREEERWPFPGTVEVWLPEGSYGERHVLATLHNLSVHGLAMRARRPIPTDTKLSIALHQPELSVYGEAIVRHCTRAHPGYLVGLEFVFGDEEESYEEQDGE